MRNRFLHRVEVLAVGRLAPRHYALKSFRHRAESKKPQSRSQNVELLFGSFSLKTTKCRFLALHAAHNSPPCGESFSPWGRMTPPMGPRKSHPRRGLALHRCIRKVYAARRFFGDNRDNAGQPFTIRYGVDHILMPNLVVRGWWVWYNGNTWENCSYSLCYCRFRG